MAASRADISRWWDNAPETATHMLVVRDTFSDDGFPVYVKPPRTAAMVTAEYRDREAVQVMEVYSFALPKDEQVNTRDWVHNTAWAVSGPLR